jgi:urease accessory protein UreH
VHRRASAKGVAMVAWQKISLGRVHAGKTVTIAITQIHLKIDCDDRVRTFRRTNTNPVTHTRAPDPASRARHSARAGSARPRKERLE